MKVFVISDLHLSSDSDKPMEIFGAVWENYWEDIKADWLAKVTAEDVVLIAGDISWGMRFEDAQKDLLDISSMPGKKVIIRGNHDYWWQSIGKIREFLPEGMYALQNDAVKFGKFVICGSRGWTVPEPYTKPKAEDVKLYERERIRIELSLAVAEKMREEGDVLIAMVHFPPFNSRFDNSYYTDMFRDHKVDAVVYGHLHGHDSRTELIHQKDNIPYYLTSCDKIDNKLVLIAEE